MNTVLHNLSQVFQKYPTRPVVVAYSGGVDSQVLLHLVTELKDLWHEKRELTVCHVHHGLSQNADDWLNFAQQQCAKYDVNFEARKVKLDLSSGESVEAQARELRYQVLGSVYAEPAIILTGHHLNDQAETFLLALKRGAGVKGLSAMAETSQIGEHLIFRSMLSTTRQAIEDFATELQLAWVEDESNSDIRYDRNFIRNSLLPTIEARWPSFSQTVIRSAELCRENQLLVEELAAQDLTLVATDNDTLDINALNQLSQPRFNNLIRHYLSKLGKRMPSQAQLNQLYRQLVSEDDKMPEITLGQVVARRFQHQLYITPVFADVSDNVIALDLSHLEKENLKLTLPDNIGCLELSLQPFLGDEGAQCFSVMNIDNLTVKFTHQNPKVLPDYRQHSRVLKKVLQELKLAPWQRKRLPFIYQQETLIAIPSHMVCKPFMANVNKQNIYVRWREK